MRLLILTEINGRFVETGFGPDFVLPEEQKKQCHVLESWDDADR